jgi:dolichol-phosphate mannosyltransferase
MILTIVIPTYNERDNILLLLEQLDGLLVAMAGAYEIIVVDDASPDNTADVVEQWRQQHAAVKLVRRQGKAGLSAALAAGFDSAHGKYLLAMDADLQHDPAILQHMLALAEKDSLDLVVATRYAMGGSTTNWNSARLCVSRVATRLAANVLHTGITDPLSGYFLVSHSCWRELRPSLHLSGFKLLLEIIATKPALRHTEVGYKFVARKNGNSKLGVTAAVAFVLALWRLSRCKAEKP